VGNGGGYGYGIMGSSHHALEDIGVVSGMQNVSCHVPAFTEDVVTGLKNILDARKPAYLRLGADVKLPGKQVDLDGFRQCSSPVIPQATIVAMGPVIKNVFEALDRSKQQADVFSAVKFPIKNVPNELITSIQKTRNLLVVEEHVPVGGLGQQLSVQLLSSLDPVPGHFFHLAATGYPGGKYGSQDYHQKRSGVDSDSIAEILEGIIV
jgi:transketolase